MKKIFPNGILFVLLFSVNYIADAQDCRLNDAVARATENQEAITISTLSGFLIDMNDLQCFEENCNDAICREVANFKEIQEENIKIKRGAVLTRKLREEVSLLPGNDEWINKFKKLFYIATDRFIQGDIGNVEGALMKISGLELYANHNSSLIGLEEISFSSGLRGTCSDNLLPLESQACIERFSVLKRAFLLHAQQNRIYEELLEARRNKTEIYLSGLNDRWNTYSDHAASLYPWERLWNAKRFENKTKEQDGFVEPPQTQLIALHPTATLEFDSNGGNNFEQSLTLELIGFHRWSYKSRYRQIGASLIASYNQSNDKVGYGVLIRLPQNWSVGVVERDGSTSTVLSVDLARLFTDNNSTRASFNRYIK